MDNQQLQRIEQPPMALKSPEARAHRLKMEWQRRKRDNFKKQHGYSLRSYYGCGGLREAVLQRDGRKCVQCGMTEQAHLERWGRPITIDHKDRNREHNYLSNLQTLCLSCHGRKDLLPELRQRKVEKHRYQILALRQDGLTYQRIADQLGFSIASIWKWIQLWNTQAL